MKKGKPRLSSKSISTRAFSIQFVLDLEFGFYKYRSTSVLPLLRSISLTSIFSNLFLNQCHVKHNLARFNSNRNGDYGGEEVCRPRCPPKLPKEGYAAWTHDHKDYQTSSYRLGTNTSQRPSLWEPSTLLLSLSLIRKHRRCFVLQPPASPLRFYQLFSSFRVSMRLRPASTTEKSTGNTLTLANSQVSTICTPNHTHELRKADATWPAKKITKWALDEAGNRKIWFLPAKRTYALPKTRNQDLGRTKRSSCSECVTPTNVLLTRSKRKATHLFSQSVLGIQYLNATANYDANSLCLRVSLRQQATRIDRFPIRWGRSPGSVGNLEQRSTGSENVQLPSRSVSFRRLSVPFCRVPAILAKKGYLATHSLRDAGEGEEEYGVDYARNIFRQNRLREPKGYEQHGCLRREGSPGWTGGCQSEATDRKQAWSRKHQAFYCI